MINSLIVNALKPLNVPVKYRKYTGAETTYITFFRYNEQGEDWAENKETATAYFMQVDVWSNADCTALSDQVRDALMAAGFIRTYATDLYELDTFTYHTVLRFVYYQ